jgi:hypothetical protein
VAQLRPPATRQGRHRHGVREVVYQRAVPLGTRSLRIARSTLDVRAGMIGVAVK